ncbi:class II aldolase/adducin family protein [Kitasatospora nipponensis]|uniref:Class II aldolase/adducin family protein n=1 Tax=Kitasatospora nipponensis TaxID=258049 RepID=A0ABN1W2P4_9ACTN
MTLRTEDAPTDPRIAAAAAAAVGAEGSGRGPELRPALPPTFATAAEEREHRKVQLAAAFRMFSRAGLDEGVAGHITVRDPEHTDSYWVNPFGLHFSLIRQSDLVRVDHTGAVVEGEGPVNAAAVAIHCAVHAARPDVVAAAHAHGPYGKTLSSLPMGIEPLTQDACAFYEDFGVHATYNGVVTGAEEGRAIGAALGNHKAVILRNHGMLTVGGSVESAAWWFLTLERTAQAQLMAYSAAAGLGAGPLLIDPEQARQTQGEIGFELAGWFQWQPIWQRISRDNPDIYA